jgi:indole-3-glycerol phosphate synthase
MTGETLTEQMPKVNTRGGFLARALVRKRAEVAAASRDRPVAELRAAAAARTPARSLAAALRGGGVSVISEVKRASPSAGLLAPGIDAAERARLYEQRGAAAISVLTDAEFDGRLPDLTAVASATSVPVLRKDFLVDPWQVWESRAAGADAALLIVAALDPDAMDAMVSEAAQAGLELLVEIHTRAEAARAIAAGAPIVGVNARDLSSLEVDLEAALATVRTLRRDAPDAIVVAESGISGPAEVLRARSAGADAVLVGEHLARAADPGEALARLVAAGRDPR